MDEKSKVQLKVMPNEYEIINKSLNKIIDTLNTETSLQEENNKLGLIVTQIESIMKSYRFDISNLRKFCVFGTILVLIVMAISIPLCFKISITIYTIK